MSVPPSQRRSKDDLIPLPIKLLEAVSAGRKAVIRVSSCAAEVVTRHHGFLAKSKLAMKAVAGWGRFWVSLVFCVLVHAALVVTFMHLNPYVCRSV